MSNFVIDPGSGPVENASLEEAESNMVAFASDVSLLCAGEVSYERNARTDRGGRYGFVLSGTQCGDHAIEMPGLPLDEVRYVGDEGQNAWDFPRLYVDDESWLWSYAVKFVAAPMEDDDNLEDDR